jgi:hypothetical protein
MLFVLVCHTGNVLAGAGQARDPKDRVININSMAGQGGQAKLTQFTLSQLESLGGQRMTSEYFDRAMDYQGSRFTAISFSRLVDRFDPGHLSDAVLLDCVDDYQGILLIDDIRRYDLQLATRIEIKAGLKRPSWLHPLLVLVPQGVSAPFQEKFMTANIRELKFVSREKYYAPLSSVVRKFPDLGQGFQSYKNNCQFCHSLRGVGGNKGGQLIKKYRFSLATEKLRFESDFARFHNKLNADKQNIEQFVTAEEIGAIGKFLAVFEND